MKKHIHCTATDFKTDISELCNKCPLVEIIENGIKNQIIFQAIQQKEILNTEQFKEYINSEIKNAQNSMQKTFLIEQQNKEYKNDNYRKTRIKNYIWNKERIKALNDFLNNDNAFEDKLKNKKYTISQIALKYVYENNSITRENGNSIALKYGHNSGEKLFQKFTHYSSTANRKGKPNLCTKKKMQNKIDLIESVIKIISDNKKHRAIDEVNILKTILENEFQ